MFSQVKEPESHQEKSHQENSFRFLDTLSKLIILFGIFIRLSQYLSNRSLWGDEAGITLNIVNRSYLELLQPLDHNQAAPPGFLWAEKLAVQLFGQSEYSLRLFPLIAGIVSLIALYQLGKWSVSVIALPIALTLMACLKYPLYYATEVKQYSSDVMVASLICLVLVSLRDKILGRKGIVLLALSGMAAIWFSHPAIFVLGGIELANLVTVSGKRRKAILINRLPVYGVWAVSFVSLYFLVTATLMKNTDLKSAWSPEYPKSIFDVVWLLDSLGRFFYRPLGFLNDMDAIAVFAFIIGCIVFLRRNKIKFLVLISPIIATLIASYLHKYPFRSRLILFLIPFFILILAEGTAFLLAHFNQKKHRSFAVVGVLVTCLLLLPPLFRASSFVFYPETRQELRPVMEYIKIHQSPADAIYVGAESSDDQFKYYATLYGYSTVDYVFGYPGFFSPEGFSEQSWKTFWSESSVLQNKKRVWFIFSGLKQPDKRQVKPYLDQMGQEIDFFSQPGAFTYLYQISPT